MIPNNQTAPTGAKTLQIFALHFWAYGFNQLTGEAVLVQCPDAISAQEESNRMKFSNGGKVGYTTTEYSELEAKNYLEELGAQKITVRSLDADKTELEETRETFEAIHVFHHTGAIEDKFRLFNELSDGRKAEFLHYLAAVAPSRDIGLEAVLEFMTDFYLNR